MLKQAKFKIEKIDLDQGLCTVRHINPYGPIESEEISSEINSNLDNLNHDIIATFEIPMQNYEYINADDLINYIAKCYPSKKFENYLIKKLAEKQTSLVELQNKIFEKTVEEIKAIDIGTIVMMQIEDGIDVETL